MNNCTEIPLLKPAVTKTGIANEGNVGPALGKVDIGASDNAYIFQVALAGVCGNLSKLKCNIRDNGRVKIEGVLTKTSLPIVGDTVHQVKIEELSPPGPFSITFKLPGPVDPRLTSLDYKLGILEGTVLKFRIPYFPSSSKYIPPQ